MKHFLLIYDTAADYLQRRAEFRSDHLAVAWHVAPGAGSYRLAAGSVLYLY
ncbi:hypothetical protein HRH59_06300 [Rheinheimera sp. YQF-2]|uniref:YCII-related domain-containing protein n=1 Tax=Rheinheimera lutimaris TaxID=2740584 RepID=A0A7Y5EKK6_9GAMM|nr:hypothetical protein [Rheinheimera lutimaris]NRQ42178.1 hypothetical protein [Rheinheimera lutimaris]